MAAFGKHPGWNDHIDDLGIETPRLVEVKRRLYVEGIGGNIDSGAWDRLEPAQQVSGFNHVFVWRRPGDVVVGRMWSSQDGKGRAKYPMIVCVQVQGAPVQWAIDQALPRLEELEAECKAATDAAGVRAAIDSARVALRGRLGRQPPSGPELSLSDRVWSELADLPSMGPGRVGVQRVLYQIERELGEYRAPGPHSVARSRSAQPGPQHLRVPATGTGPAGEAMVWMRAMLSQLTPTAEIAVLVPLGREWVDVLIGPPDGPQFFCLRASPKAVPLVSDIPYTLDPEFLERAESMIEAGRSAPERQVALGPAEVVTRHGLLARLTGWAKPRTGLLVGIIGGLAAILAGVGLTVRGCLGDDAFPVSAPDHIATSAPPQPRGPLEAPEPAWDAGPWRELVAMHRQWFGPLVKRLDDPPSVAPPGAVFQTRRQMYESDPTLAGLMASLDAARAHGAIDPLGIAGVPRGDLVSLERNPPESVRASGAQVDRVVVLARGFRDALGGSWPVIASLRAAADSFEARGWTEPAAFLRQVHSTAVPVDGLDPAPGIDMALVVAGITQSIIEELGGMDRHSAALAATGDPILRTYPVWAVNTVGEAAGAGLTGLIAMRKAALDAERTGSRLAMFLDESWESLDQEAFATSRVRTEFVGSPTADTFERWLTQAAQYPSLDPALNPVQTWHAPRRLEEIDAIVGTLSSEFGRPLDPEERERLDGLKSRVVALPKEAWNRASEQRVREAAQQIDQGLDETWEGLTARLERARAERVGSAKEARERLRARERVVAASAALNAAWVGWRDQLVEQTPDTEYASMLARAGDLEEVLGEFSAAPASNLAPESSAGWAAALRDAAAADQESRFSGALRPLLSPVPEPAEVRRVLGAAAIEHAAWVKEANAIAALARAMEASLAGAFTLDERGAGGQTLREAADALEASPVVRSEPIAASLAGLRGRVEAVRAVDEESDAARLAAMVLAEGAEGSAALAAWRKLGTHGRWPLTVEDLALERDAGAVIGRIADSLEDQARSGMLREELAGERAARWEWCVSRQSGGAEIEAAAMMMGDFGVQAERIADPRVRYNALLARLKGSCVGQVAEPAAAAAAQGFVAAARVLDGVVLAPGVPDLLAGLEAVSSGGEPAVPTVDVTTLGPGSAGWEGVSAGARVRFTRDGVTLEFIRVEPAEGVPDAVYLCTEELSVAAASTALRTSGAARSFAAMTTGGERRAVQTWMATDAGFSHASAWIEFPIGTEAGYPVFAAAGRPSPEHPVQRLSPGAALYLARLLGCRLPTPQEWRAGLVATDTVGPPESWNLRDARWQQWQEQAAAVAQSAKVPTWPDEEVFWPAGFDKGPLRGGAARAVHGGDDGFALFAPVSTGPDRALRHMLGNVAEYVIDGLDQGLEPVDPDAIARALRASPAAVRVVGGSALSDPAIPPDQPQPVDAFDIEDSLGFSDVGLRLAFDGKGAAPARQPLAAQVVELIDRAGYLPPG